MCLQYKSFENTLGKGEIARNEQFLLFQQCFLTIWRVFYQFHQIWNCRLQSLSIWKRPKFVVWERVKHLLGVCQDSSFPTIILSESIGSKIPEIEFGQNILLYAFSWPERLWPKCPGLNVCGQNVLAWTSVAKMSWPERLCPKCPGLNVCGQNVLAWTSVAKMSWPERLWPKCPGLNVCG